MWNESNISLGISLNKSIWDIHALKHWYEIKFLGGGLYDIGLHPGCWCDLFSCLSKENRIYVCFIQFLHQNSHILVIFVLKISPLINAPFLENLALLGIYYKQHVRLQMSAVCLPNIFRFCLFVLLKALICRSHSHSQGATERSSFLMLHESPYFSHYKPQISASNSLYFVLYSRKCTYFWYTNFYFLIYFHNSLIPSVTSLFLPHERK